MLDVLARLQAEERASRAGSSATIHAIAARRMLRTSSSSTISQVNDDAIRIAVLNDVASAGISKPGCGHS